MKNSGYTFLLFCLCFAQFGWTQCDTLPIDPAQMLVLVEREVQGFPASYMLDDDSATFWRTPDSRGFPHIIEMDLGGDYIIDQIQILARQDNTNGRLAGYEIFASLDGDFVQAEAIGTLTYEGAEDSTARIIRFGAIEARFLKIIATSNAGGNRNRLMIAELQVYENPCAETGRQNQTLRFATIPKQLSTASFVPDINSSSGLVPEIEVVDGPASIENGLLQFTGEEGTVRLRAFHAGNESFYPTENFYSFPVINPERYEPHLQVRLTEAYSLEMPELMPYLLSANSSIEHDDLFEIEKVEFEINGDTYPAERIKNGYQHWWQVSEYGTHQITVKSYASNGKVSSETRLIEVVTAENTTKSTQPLDQDLILFGGENSRWLYKTVNLPQFVGAYQGIKADFWTTCPDIPGECDDWDRKAWIDVKGPDGNWIEIIRYITPYGRGCEHQIDLTDYTSILQGEVEMRMFIDTWGTGGWEVHLRLEYEPGTPEYPYSHVEPLWDGTFDFGNPLNLQPLDTLNYQFPVMAQTAKLKVATTGHGWGNNNFRNAAEFYEATHYFNINGTRTFTQHLWMECDPNPDDCQPQSGTYRFPRAGWCPGALAQLYEYNFNSYIGAESLELSYIFDPTYLDTCHPNNPACVTGLTCGDCNAGFNPHYEVAANMIVHGNAPVLSSTKSLVAKDLAIRIFPNPAQDYFVLQSEDFLEDIEVQLQTLSGQVLEYRHLKSTADLAQQLFDIRSLPTAMYVIQLKAKQGVQTLKMMKK